MAIKIYYADTIKGGGIRQVRMVLIFSSLKHFTSPTQIQNLQVAMPGWLGLSTQLLTFQPRLCKPLSPYYRRLGLI